MIKQTRNMEQLSYGIMQPSDLLAKLRLDAEKLNESPHRYDVFNFILTASALAEWIQKYYSSECARAQFSTPKRGCKNWVLPDMSPQWIGDTGCIPNPHGDFKRDIANALSICCHTANASKHFRWNDGGVVTSIGEKPPIGSWSQYFFTSTAPDLYLDFQGENYSLGQIKSILLQFYAGLIEYLDGLQTRTLSDR